MNFKATTNNPTVQNILSNLKLLDDEPILSIEEEHIRIVGLNKSNTMFHEILLDNTLFLKYELEQPFKIGLNSQKLAYIMGRCSNSEIEFEINDENIKIIAKGDNTRTFKIGAIMADYTKTVQPPILPEANQLTVSSETIKQAVSDSKLFDKANNLKFNYDSSNDALKISASSKYDGGLIEVETIVENECKHKTDCEPVFNSDYLETIMKFETLNNEWEMNLGEDLPVQFTAKDMGFCLSFIVAPIIDVE